MIKTGIYMDETGEHSFEFKTNLSTSEKVKFVHNVSDIIVTDKNYHSVLRDLVFDYVSIRTFAPDVDLEYLENKDVIDNMEYIVNNTTILSIIKENMIYGLWDELNKAVDDNISYITGIRVTPMDSLFNSLTRLLDTVERKLGDIDTNNLMEMTQLISGISGDLTAEKMLEAYSKTDLFKNKHREILKQKEVN